MTIPNWISLDLKNVEKVFDDDMSRSQMREGPRSQRLGLTFLIQSLTAGCSASPSWIRQRCPLAF